MQMRKSIIGYVRPQVNPSQKPYCQITWCLAAGSPSSEVVNDAPNQLDETNLARTQKIFKDYKGQVKTIPLRLDLSESIGTLFRGIQLGRQRPCASACAYMRVCGCNPKGSSTTITDRVNYTKGQSFSLKRIVNRVLRIEVSGLFYVCSFRIVLKRERKQNRQGVNSRQIVSKQGEPIARRLPYLKIAFGSLRGYFRGVGQVKDRFAIRIPPQCIQRDSGRYPKGQDYTNGQIVYILKDIRLVQRDR